MNSKQRKMGLAVGLLLGLIAFFAYLFNCDRRVTIARLLLPQARQVVITGENCWEISQPLCYRVTKLNQVRIPETYLGTVTGSGRDYGYQVFSAEGGNLIGVVRTQKSSFTQSPSSTFPELILLKNFQSGETWTPQQQSAESWNQSPEKIKAIAQNYRNLFDRLRRKNPSVPLPDFLAQTAPTLH